MPESKNVEPDPVKAASVCERAGSPVFVDPTLEQVDAAAELGVEMVELHTGKLSNAFSEKIEKQELSELQAAAKAASELHLQVNAGHGINYRNIELIHKIPHLTELNI